MSNARQQGGGHPARARRVGVADLCNACGDWSTVRKCRPIIRRDVCDKCRRHFDDECEQAVSGQYFI